MVDLAQVGFEADSAPLKAASDALDELGKRAYDTADAVDQFNEETKENATATGKMQAALDRLLGPLSSMKGLLGGMFAGFSLAAIGNMADTWSDVSSRVGVAIGDMEAASGVMEKLSTTARLTYSTLSQTAEGFVRNSTVLQALGKTTEEQIAYTEALNLALVASGTKAQQALAVQEALSKGMSEGRLATEQLMTVLNGSSEVTKALADELGVSVLGLTALAREGRITADVIYNTLTKRLEEFTQKAEEMPATLGDGFLLIGNAVTVLIGTFDQLSGVTATVAGLLVNLSDAILWLAGNSETVSKVLWTIAPAAIAAFGPTVLTMVLSLASAIGTTLVGAVTALFTLVRAHPFMTIVTVVSMVISAMYQWRDSFPAIGAMFDWLWEKASFVIETIKVALDALAENPVLKWFFGDSSVTAEIDGEKAASQIENSLISGGGAAASQIEGAIVRGGAQAGATMAQMQEAAQQRAVARYQEMNGKAVQQLGNALIEGGKYIYNEVTGGVTAAGGQMQENIESGGVTAGEEMENRITAGGKAAGSQIYSSMESAFASLGHIFQVFETFLRRERVELAKIQAETAKLLAEARAINRGGSSGGGGGGGGRGGGSGGGTPAGHYNYVAPNPLSSVGSNPALRNTPEATSAAPVNVTVVNTTDPHDTVAAMDSAEGHEVIVNAIKYSREEILTLLGVY